jgi:hypothetical protein
MHAVASKIVLITGSLMMVTPVAGVAQERHGFWFNGGLGYGSLGCDNCGSREGGLSGGLSLGGTLSPMFLLGVGTTGWYKDEGGASLTAGTVDARIRFYPSTTGGFFLTGGLGVGSVRVAVDGFGSASETGAGAMLGLGYDIRIGSSLSLTPFWNGFAVRTSNTDANVGQLGLSLTVHKFQQAAAPPREARPVVGSATPPISEPGYHPFSPPAPPIRHPRRRRPHPTASPCRRRTPAGLGSRLAPITLATFASSCTTPWAARHSTRSLRSSRFSSRPPAVPMLMGSSRAPTADGSRSAAASDTRAGRAPGPVQGHDASR